ncbi:MAG: MATE family efflux transporter [Rickettsiales bacterium]
MIFPSFRRAASRLVFSLEEKASFLRLLALGGPVMGGIFFAVSLSAMDIWYISLLGSEPLEAVSFALPVMLAVSHGLMGLGTGVTVTIAHYLGAGRRARASRAARNVVLMAVALSALLAWAGIVSIGPLFSALGAQERHMGYLSDFMVPWYSLCVPALAGMTLANAVLRGCENTATPARAMGVAALINGVADPLFIFGWGPIPGHGVQGAALATAFALMVGCLWALAAARVALPKPDKAFGTRLRDVRDVFFVGFPAMTSQLFPPLAQLFVTSLLGRGVGGAAVAGYGLAMRVETLALVFFMGLSVAVNIDAARKFGANDVDGLATLRRTFLKASFWAGGAILALLWLCAWLLMPHMAPNENITQAARDYLCIGSLGVGAVGACICSSSFLNAARRPGPALGLYALRCAVLLWPLACLGKYYAGHEGAFAGMAAANFLTAIVAVRWMR